MIQKAVFLNELLNDTKCPPLIDVRSEECCHIRNFIMKSGLEKNNRVGPDKKQCRRNTYWHSPYILNIEYILHILKKKTVKWSSAFITKGFEKFWGFSHQIQQKMRSKSHKFKTITGSGPKWKTALDGLHKQTLFVATWW